VLSLAGQVCTLKVSSDVNQAFNNPLPSQPALEVALRFNGQAIVLGLSESLVNALLAEQQIVLSDANVDILNLLIHQLLLFQILLIYCKKHNQSFRQNLIRI
jgi:hypothetical protein